MPVIKIIGFQCGRCGNKWAPKRFQPEGDEIKLPLVCPQCHSKRWNETKDFDYPGSLPDEYIVPVKIFIKSHVKAGHNHEKIFDSILKLSQAETVRNPKAWLEAYWNA